MGIFIQITTNDARITPDVARKVARLCPVDIFAMDEDRLIVKPDQEDECTLCRLCLDAAPAGAIAILKTYTGETLTAAERHD